MAGSFTRRAQAVSGWLDKPGPSRFNFIMALVLSAVLAMVAVSILFATYGIMQSYLTVEAFYHMSERYESEYVAKEGKQAISEIALPRL